MPAKCSQVRLRPLLARRSDGRGSHRDEGQVVDHLSNYSWPGNIRELEHQIEKAVVMSGDRRQLYATDFAILPAGAPAEDLGQDMQFLEPGLDFGNLMMRIERALLGQALKKAQGNKARAAG